MKIKIILDHTEVKSMVDKMRHKGYSRSKIYDAGRKILKAYEEFEKVELKNKPSENQMTLDDVLNSVGGKIIE